MEKIRAGQEQALFFALEQKSRRRQRDAHWFSSLASLLYEVTCDYGRSLGRPLMLLAMSALAFWAAYELVAHLAGSPSKGQDAVRFTFEQLFRPFLVWSPKYAEGDNLAWFAVAPLVFRLLATLQSLISIGLVAVFLVALRRRFRMD